MSYNCHREVKSALEVDIEMLEEYKILYGFIKGMGSSTYVEACNFREIKMSLSEGIRVSWVPHYQHLNDKFEEVFAPQH